MTERRTIMEVSPTPDSKRRRIKIETPHLILRGAEVGDAEHLFDCFSDPEVMRYWESLPHSNVDVTKKWVEKMINGKNNGVSDFVICLKPTETHATSDDVPMLNKDGNCDLEIIGKVGIWHDDEIGFLLNRKQWGKGLALEAIREVLDLAFNLGNYEAGDAGPGLSTSGHDRADVVADVDPRNAASLGILKKLGFEVYDTKEKTFKVGDDWVDSVYLSLKRDTWVQRRETVKR